MDANKYQSLAMRTCNIENKKHKIEHALHGMVSEIGEIHGIYQKEYQGHDIDPRHLFKEVGDLLWFIAEFVDAHDWCLSTVMMANIEKLKKRYPNGFEEERSLHREEGDI